MSENRINPEELYWDNIRSIHYLFSPYAVRYARGYLKAGQKRYYEKKKDDICRQRAERYKNDPEYRERIKRVASERGRRVRAMRKCPAEPLPVLEEVEVDSLPVFVGA